MCAAVSCVVQVFFDTPSDPCHHFQPQIARSPLGVFLHIVANLFPSDTSTIVSQAIRIFLCDHVNDRSAEVVHTTIEYHLDVCVPCVNITQHFHRTSFDFANRGVAHEYGQKQLAKVLRCARTRFQRVRANRVFLRDAKKAGIWFEYGDEPLAALLGPVSSHLLLWRSRASQTMQTPLRALRNDRVWALIVAYSPTQHGKSFVEQHLIPVDSPIQNRAHVLAALVHLILIFGRCPVLIIVLLLLLLLFFFFFTFHTTSACASTPFLHKIFGNFRAPIRFAGFMRRSRGCNGHIFEYVQALQRAQNNAALRIARHCRHYTMAPKGDDGVDVCEHCRPLQISSCPQLGPVLRNIRFFLTAHVR